MASRRGIGQALQQSSNLIQSIIEMKLRAQIDEASQRRQADYASGRARETAGYTSDRNMTEFLAAHPEAAERFMGNGMGRVGGVNVSPFRSTPQERLNSLLKNIEDADTEPKLPTWEAMLAKAQGLAPDQLTQLRAAFDARKKMFGDLHQRGLNEQERYDPTLGTSVADRGTLGTVQLAPTPTQKGENTLAEAQAGVFSDAYAKAKGNAFNIEDALTRGSRAASAGAIANAQASGSVQGEWNAKSLMLPKMVEVTRALEQAKQSGDAVGSARATQNAMMLAKQMVDLSNKLNFTEGGKDTLIQNGRQLFGKWTHQNNDRMELDSLSEGYAPIFARLIGHTGVLTQQDVDSVRRIMPRAGLNRDESARINLTFMQTLQGAQQINALLGDIDPTLPKEAQSLEMRRRLDLAQQYAVTGKLELEVK